MKSSSYCKVAIFLSISKLYSLPLNTLASFRRHRQLHHSMASTISETSFNEIESFDKSVFDQTLQLVSLKIPAKSCNEYMRVFKDFVWKRPKMKRIFDIPGEPNSRLLLLSEEVSDVSLSCLPEQLNKFNDEMGGVPQYYEMKIGYNEMTVEGILRRLLPANIEIPSSYEQAGHLAHLNLRPEAFPYKRIIGQVILDKNPTIRTVVNKVGNIETEFRTFPMELLAGDDNYNVTLKESNSTFTFNFGEVYWNR